MDSLPDLKPVENQAEVVTRIQQFITKHADADSNARVKYRTRAVTFIVSFDPAIGLRLQVLSSLHIAASGGGRALKPRELKRVKTLETPREYVIKPILTVKWKRDGSLRNVPDFELQEYGSGCDAMTLTLTLELLRILGGKGRSTAILYDNSWLSCSDLLTQNSRDTQEILTTQDSILTTQEGALMLSRKFRLLTRGEKNYNDIGFKSTPHVVDPHEYNKHMSILKSTSVDALILKLIERNDLVEEALIRRVPVECVYSSQKFKLGGEKLKEVAVNMKNLSRDLQWASYIFREYILIKTQQTQTSSSSRVNSIANIVKHAAKIDCRRCGILVWSLLPSLLKPVPVAIQGGKDIALIEMETAVRYVANVATSALFCDL